MFPLTLSAVLLLFFLLFYLSIWIIMDLSIYLFVYLSNYLPMHLSTYSYMILCNCILYRFYIHHAIICYLLWSRILLEFGWSLHLDDPLQIVCKLCIWILHTWWIIYWESQRNNVESKQAPSYLLADIEHNLISFLHHLRSRTVWPKNNEPCAPKYPLVI